MIKNPRPFRVVPAPLLSSSQEKALKEAQKRIEKDPKLFDGSVWHSDKDTVFEASFAWHLAKANMPGDGPLGVALILRSKKDILWQKRSSDVLAPGLWDLSAAGTLDKPNPREVIIREAAEEIGVLIDPRLLGIWRDEESAFFLFEADWGGESIVLSEEVEEVAWAQRPPGQALSRWEDFLHL